LSELKLFHTKETKTKCKMLLKFKFLILLLSSAQYFPLIKAEESLRVIENSLSEAEKDHTLGAALFAIEKSNDANTIANEIVAEVSKKYIGDWNCFVTVINDNSLANRASLKLKVMEKCNFLH